MSSTNPGPVPDHLGTPTYSPQTVQATQPVYKQDGFRGSSFQPGTQSDPPPQPPQDAHPPTGQAQPYLPTYDPSSYATGQESKYIPPPPPQRIAHDFGDDDPGNPVYYVRDPHKLIAYLVPFPKPHIRDLDPKAIPDRFLIYTPPPPPLAKPAEGEKESKLHKVQRKWQEEVRQAKTSDAKTASWKGVKGKATKGINWAMNQTTTSNLDFLGRLPDGNKSDHDDGHTHDGVEEGDTTKKTIGVEELLLIYPPTFGVPQEQMREEFVNSMLRTKTKAQRDAIISTGLMPIAYGIDILATLVWPFGGLGEIDTVWAYSSIRGAKTARSVTKRLSSASASGSASTSAASMENASTLRLNFSPSRRVDLLARYLAADCHKTDANLFPNYVSAPTESDVLEAIGWSPAQNGGGESESRNWEDEQWEMREVKDDLRLVMHKGAKEWRRWSLAFAKAPEKAMKK